MLFVYEFAVYLKLPESSTPGSASWPMEEFPRRPAEVPGSVPEVELVGHTEASRDADRAADPAPTHNFQFSPSPPPSRPTRRTPLSLHPPP